MLYYFAKYVLGYVALLFWRPRVIGREGLGIKGPAIFIANHISMWDPVLLALVSPRIIHFMAKKEIFKRTVGRCFFKALLAFPINRKTADLASLRNAMTLLKQGKVFGVFPEGKRSITYELDELENGAAFMALRSGAPVVPIYIHPSSYLTPHPKICVGTPIYGAELVAGLPHAEKIKALTAAFEAALLENKAKLEAAL